VRLSIRIMSLFLLGFLVLLVADGYFLVRLEVQIQDRVMRRNALHLGRTFKELVLHQARVEGEQPALDLVRQLDREQHRLEVRWTWLDRTGDDPQAPRLNPRELEPVAKGKEISLKRTGYHARGYRFTYVPVTLPDGRQGAIEVSESLDELRAYDRTIITRSFLLGGLMALIALIMVWTVGVPLVGRPLSRLVEKTERIGAGDFSGDLLIRGHGELSDLAVAMNRMCVQLAAAQQTIRSESEARIAALEQLRHSERLAMLGRIASGIAHEMGTPLNVVSGRAKMIATAGLSPEEINECGQIIQRQADRMTGTIRELLDFARPRSSEHQPIRVDELATRVVQMLQPLAAESGIGLDLIMDDDLPSVRADRSQLEQVMMNLITNAIHAMPGGGTVGLEVRRGSVNPDTGRTITGLVIRVRDEGSGIDARHLPQIFEPFFTTKQAGAGTGLGLSIVKGIVEEHGGRIEVASEKGQGSCFSVYLPLEEPE
jgi:two-component system NtrC family sensor kinase